MSSSLKNSIFFVILVAGCMYLHGMPMAEIASTAPAISQPLPSQPAAMTMPATQSAPIAMPTGAPSNPSSDLTNTFQSLEQIKKDLGTLIKNLDEKLLEARKQTAEAKSLSKTILQAQESEARSILEKVQALRAGIDTTQRYAQGEFAENFNKKYGEFEAIKMQVEAILQKTSTANPVTPIPTATQGAAPSAPVTVTANSISRKANWLIDSITSIIATVFSSIKKVFATARTGGNTNQTAPTTVVIGQQTQTTQISNQSAHTTGAAHAFPTQQTPTIPSTLQNVAAPSQHNEAPLDIVNGGWKRPILLLMGKILDGVAYMGKSIYAIFDSFFGSFVRKFIKDVQRKIASQETTPEQSSAT